MHCVFSLVGHIERPNDIIMELDVIPQKKNDSFAWPGIEKKRKTMCGTLVGMWPVTKKETFQTLRSFILSLGQTPFLLKEE